MGRCPAFFRDGLSGEIHHAIGLIQCLFQLRHLPGLGPGGIELQPLHPAISALGLKNYSTSFTDVVRECQATNTLCHDVTSFVT